jgi:FkbM family methyltransferase
MFDMQGSAVIRTARSRLRQPVGQAMCALPLLTAARRLPTGTPRSLAQLALNRRTSIITVGYQDVPTRFGFTMSGDTTDLLQRYIYVFGVWEPNLSRWMDRNLSRGDVVVDIGANVGYFSLLAAHKVGDAGRVIAFEPVPAFADAMRRDLMANDFSHVDMLPYAASETEGELEMFVAEDWNLGRSTTEAMLGYQTVAKVRSVRAADVIDETYWPRIRLVKVDVEGDELRALRGMRELLATLSTGAAVVAEVAPDRLAVRGQTAAEAVGFMRELGFSPFSIHNEYVARHYAFDAPRDPQPLLGVPTEQVDVLFIKK